jgi:hypothetical protein
VASPGGRKPRAVLASLMVLKCTFALAWQSKLIPTGLLKMLLPPIRATDVLRIIPLRRIAWQSRVANHNECFPSKRGVDKLLGAGFFR